MFERGKALNFQIHLICLLIRMRGPFMQFRGPQKASFGPLSFHFTISGDTSCDNSLWVLILFFSSSPILPTTGARLHSLWRWWNFILDKHSVSFQSVSAAAVAARLFWAHKPSQRDQTCLWMLTSANPQAYLEIGWLYRHYFGGAKNT